MNKPMTQEELNQWKEESIAQAYDRLEGEFYAQNAEPNFPWKSVADVIREQYVNSAKNKFDGTW